MRRVVFAVSAAALVVLEIAVLVQVAHLVGWWTLPLLLVTSLLGGWLVKRAGVRSLAALRGATESGQSLDGRLADTGVVLACGLLVLLPGFVTDLAGILFVLPPVRPLSRRIMLAVLGRQIAGLENAVPSGFGAGGGQGDTPQAPGPIVEGKVVSRDDRVDPGDTVESTG